MTPSLVQQTGPVSREPDEPSVLPLVLGGSPVARSLDLTRSADGLLTSNLWDCTAGQVRFTYHADEIIHILEGEARLTDADGHVREISAGDVIHFSQGAVVDWDVPRYVKKLAVWRTPHLLARVARKLSR